MNVTEWMPNKFYLKWTLFIHAGLLYRVINDMVSPLTFNAADYEEINACP